MSDLVKRLRERPTFLMYLECADEIERLQAELDKCDETMIKAAIREKEWQAELAALRSALNALYAACPITLECQHFHHTSRDRHTYAEGCKQREDYLAAIEAAGKVLKEAMAREGNSNG